MSIFKRKTPSAQQLLGIEEITEHMTRDEYSKMRGSSVREVASTHGNISFKDVLLFHQEE